MGVHAHYVLPFDALQHGHNWDRVPTTTQHNAPKPICPVLDRVGRDWCGSGATCWAEGTVSPSPAVPKRPMMGGGQTEGIRSSPPCSLSRAKGTKPAGLVAPIGGSGGGMSHCHLWGRRWQRVSGWVLAAGGTGTTRICHPNLKATRKKKKTKKPKGFWGVPANVGPQLQIKAGWGRGGQATRETTAQQWAAAPSPCPAPQNTNAGELTSLCASSYIPVSIQHITHGI